MMSTSFRPIQNVDTTAKIKSLFIYNFTKYVDWPVTGNDTNFVIGVLGDYPALYEELSRMAAAKKRGDQVIKISSFEDTNQIKDCHILYVESSISDQLSKVISKIEGKHILLVTEGEGLAKKGAGISFYDSDNKQKMEINPLNVEKYQLKISSQLMALATVVK